MIIVHHLDDSRSQRILWLLEELGEPYEIEQHRRDPVTRAAPAALKQIHPFGQFPPWVPIKSTTSPRSVHPDCGILGDRFLLAGLGDSID